MMISELHGYIEYSIDGSDWDCWSGRINLPRSAETFVELAGGSHDDEEPVIAPRGIPEDVSELVMRAYFGSGVPEGLLSGHDKAELMNTAAVRDVHTRNGLVYRAPFKFHHASWLWSVEFHRVLQWIEWHSTTTIPSSYMAVLMAMQAFEHGGVHSARFVFWFEN